MPTYNCRLILVVDWADERYQTTSGPIDAILKINGQPEGWRVSWMPFRCSAYWLMYQMATATKMSAISQAM
jgi:hypothetical protein